MGITQLCKLYDFYQNKMFECKSIWINQACFIEDLFDIDMQRKPVANSLWPTASKIQFSNGDWMDGFHFFWRNYIKISFVN